MDRVDHEAGFISVDRTPSLVAGQAVERLSPVAKVRLGIEIVVAYAQVRRALRRLALPELVELLRASSRWSLTRGPLSDGSREGTRLGRAVVRVLEQLPFDSRCLMRSLVLLRLLAQRGTSGTLLIAVQRNTEPGLEAHAWVELEGQPLLMPAGADYHHLVTL